MGLKVLRSDNGIFMENTYILMDQDQCLSAVVDPGTINDDLINAISSTGSLDMIILTHGHGDHMAAISEYTALYPEAKIIASSDEKHFLTDPELNNSKSIAGKEVAVEADIYVEDGQVIKFGTHDLRFIKTPGHTPGGMCIYTEGLLFSGDTLFRLSVGRTDLAEADTESLMESISNKLYSLPDETLVYPGHGPETTIGLEKRMNPFV